ALGRDKNFINHRGRGLVNAEWIKGGCRIGVEQRGAQRIVVDDWAKAFVAAIFVIAEPGLPVPCPEIVSKLTQITLETAGELVVMGCNLVGTQPCFQSSVTHAGRKLGSGRHSTYVTPRSLRIRSSRRGVIGHCEWVERI